MPSKNRVKNRVRFTYALAFLDLAGRCAGRALAKQCAEEWA